MVPELSCRVKGGKRTRVEVTGYYGANTGCGRVLSVMAPAWGEPGRPGTRSQLHHLSSAGGHMAYPSLCLSDLICERGQGVDMLGIACGQ